MYDTYARIFTRLGLAFRAVQADTGAIGGNASHEFQVLADSGEDAIAFATRLGLRGEHRDGRSRRARDRTACAFRGTGARRDADAENDRGRHGVLEIAPSRCIKTIIVRGREGLVALCVRGDHEINEVKAAKLAELPGESVLAGETEIIAATGTKPGFIGPVGLPDSIPVIVDRSAAVVADFVCGGNEDGSHYRGANWDRDARVTRIADIRKIVEGDPSPDGQGTLRIARGIEVGHVFQLGRKYAEAMGANVLDAAGQSVVMHMGCYGIGVSRIVAAAIEQNNDGAGIVWPEPMAPWRVAICPINAHQSDKNTNQKCARNPSASIASSSMPASTPRSMIAACVRGRCSPTSS